MTNEEIKKILENHQHWLNEDVDGWREMRANFACADLEGINLEGADLEDADLEGANLRGADLRRANLARADLANADLGNADLEEADLEQAYLVNARLNNAYLGNVDFRGANLRGVNLNNADLEGINLEGADLEGANLRGADLRGADLRRANLARADLANADLGNADFRGANLRGVNLNNAYLRGADLRSAENVPFIPMTCPEEGGFIGWKKARLWCYYENCIIKLHIPEDAKRSSATGHKCRCNKAKVLSIEGIKTGQSFETAASIYDKRFIYKVGEYVEVDNFDEDRFNECAPGIHFFINKQEAIDY